MAQVASMNPRGSGPPGRPKVTPIDGKAEPRSTPLGTADQRLLGFLVKAGKMDRGEAEAAKTACEAQGLSLIEFIVTGNRLSDHEVADSLAQGLGLPRLRLEAVQVDEWVAGLVDQPTATRAGLVAVSADEETVTLAMVNPFDLDAIKYVEFSSGRRVRRAVAARSEILDTIGRVYDNESTLAAVLADVPEGESVELIPGTTPSSSAHEIDAGRLAQEAEQAPIVKMVNLILVDAVASKASDIHVEPGPNVVLVRYRIDGILVDGHRLPKWVQNPLTARIKIMAKADITERRTPQDGHFTIRQEGRLIDVRVSVLPTTDGEKFVLRMLDPNSVPRRLDQIGMDGRDLEVMRELIHRPEGIILAVNKIITNAIDRNASDIHVEPFESNLLVRYRIDGILHEVQD
ncbi:MAG: Flp pilus assembly complex ATPase component TadA, partial [Deltaproteobacteria bacterium]|nr:Flp pilus assembly complex ATPase component TadA [Deltaproteobacteria bacterium]